MVKKTITHSLTITVDGSDTPITVSDATAALVALEAYKMGKPFITVPGEDDCVIYINSKYIIAVQDCPTESEETVVDNTCVVE